jgi:UDP-N-acetylmuramoyl-tripeptide--D-alanyl-D-alanine ligase
MERVSLDELATATRGTLSTDARRIASIGGVSIDSRDIMPGQVFWAVRGQTYDGHSFVNDAFRRGASAAVVEQPICDPLGPTLTVADSVVALGDFAAWYRSLLDAFVIGVTGSVGKTTTRELVFAALGGSEIAVRSRKNFNNRFGVPLTLLDIEQGHRFAVVEMGADRVGEIASLAKIARPEIGVLTWLGVAHVATFGSEEAIVRSKAELIESLPAGGIAVLPGDQPKARPLALRTRAQSLFVGSSDLNALRVQVNAALPGRLVFSIEDAIFEVAATGRHFAVPAGMAVAVARCLGRTDSEIARGLKDFRPVAGRCRIAVSTPWTIVDDTYNANPDSMRAALDGLAEWPRAGRRVFVCGDMYGLGDGTAKAHIELGGMASNRGIDLVVAIGDQASLVADGACRAGMDAGRIAVFPDGPAAAQWLATSLREGDVVWAKGSRPMKLEVLVEELCRVAEAATVRRRAA